MQPFRFLHSFVLKPVILSLISRVVICKLLGKNQTPVLGSPTPVLGMKVKRGERDLVIIEYKPYQRPYQ